MADFTLDIPDLQLGSSFDSGGFGGGFGFGDYGSSFSMPAMDWTMPSLPAFEAPQFQAQQWQAPSFEQAAPLATSLTQAYPPANPQGQRGFGDWWGGLSGPGKLGAILAGGTAVAGLAGALQQAFGGGGKTKTTTVQKVPPPGPDELAIRAQAMANARRMDPQLQAALDQIARNQQLLMELQQAAIPVAQQAPDLAAQQAQILGALAPTATGLAGGQMMLTPEIQRTIEQAFEPAMGDIARQAIESARNRGWAGGAELLAGPGAPIAGPALADLQGQMAKAKLEYGLALPQAAATIAGAYTQPLETRLGAGIPVTQEGARLAAALQGVSKERADQLLRLLQLLQEGRTGQATSIVTGEKGPDYAAAAGTLADTLSGLGQYIGGRESAQALAQQMENQRILQEQQRQINQMQLERLMSGQG
jgi:hypothetical protein